MSELIFRKGCPQTPGSTDRYTQTRFEGASLRVADFHERTASDDLESSGHLGHDLGWRVSSATDLTHKFGNIPNVLDGAVARQEYRGVMG
jgi:hypothetical protein